MEDVNKDFESTEKECFLRNAFLFYQNRDRILADSRMANAVVPIHLGTWGLSVRQLTLGGYLRWWSDSVQGILESKDDRIGLVYYVNGNPMSGSCIKRFVTEDGRDEFVKSSGFLSCLKSLLNAQESCRDNGYDISPMSLQEVEDLLRTECPDLQLHEQRTPIDVWNLRVRLLKSELETARKCFQEQRHELYLTRLLWKKADLTELHRKRQEYKKKFDAELEELQNRRRELKKQHKEGLIDDKAFLKPYMVCRKREREIAEDIRKFDDVEFQKVWPWNSWTMNLDEMIADLRVDTNLTKIQENGNNNNQENG